LWSVEVNMNVTIGNKKDSTDVGGQTPIIWFLLFWLLTDYVKTRVVRVHTETLLRSLIVTKRLTKQLRS